MGRQKSVGWGAWHPILRIPGTPSYELLLVSFLASSTQLLTASPSHLGNLLAAAYSREEISSEEDAETAYQKWAETDTRLAGVAQ